MSDIEGQDPDGETPSLLSKLRKRKKIDMPKEFDAKENQMLFEKALGSPGSANDIELYIRKGADLTSVIILYYCCVDNL